MENFFKNNISVVARAIQTFTIQISTMMWGRNITKFFISFNDTKKKKKELFIVDFFLHSLGFALHMNSYGLVIMHVTGTMCKRVADHIYLKWLGKCSSYNRPPQPLLKSYQKNRKQNAKSLATKTAVRLLNNKVY
uniref:Uncharacterized protein n=1 Tax=Glossina pallidipes TaxID=7398 RepID=A0A1A9Z8B4_GLOPL